jgi:hypothetical protein
MSFCDIENDPDTQKVSPSNTDPPADEEAFFGGITFA